MAHHERLLVYRAAIEAAVELDAVASRVPEARRDLRDQLRRASASVALNVAEGAGEFSPAEKARFYRMAKRSATECMAILDLLHHVQAGSLDIVRPKAKLREIVAMLVTLSKNVESKAR